MAARKTASSLVPGDWVIRRGASFDEIGPYQVVETDDDKITIVSGAHPVCRFDRTMRVAAKDLLKITDVSGLSLWFPRQNHKAWSHGVALVGGDDAWQIEVEGASGIHKIPFRNPLLNDGEKALWIKDFHAQPDPIEMLRLGMTSRVKEMNVARSYRKWINEQIHASVGFSAIMSAPIRPAHHQLNAMARVLGDPTLRFLLADEVGLGKTIEASLILKQLLLDGAISNATIAVPRALKSQWTQELISKISLNYWISSGKIQVIDHEDLTADLRTDLLIVDEAHRFCRGEQESLLFPRLKTASERVDKLLLISATPMRNDPYMLLQLLHLLDPRNYRLDEEESFRNRLAMRVRQSNALRLLKPSTSDDQRRYLVGTLRANIPDDFEINLLISTIEKAETNSPELSVAIETLRTEIEERFRISRRLVRNRRSAIDQEDFPFSGRSHEFINFKSESSTPINDFLEEWRLRSLMTEWEVVEPIFASLLEHLLGGCVSTRTWIQQRLDELSIGSAAMFDTEKNLLENFRVLVPISDDAPEFFLKFFEPSLTTPVEPHVVPQKTVLCSGSTARAKAIYENLFQRFGPRVVMHVESQSEEENDVAIQRFGSIDDTRVLVIDRSAEEGLNLQVARTIINVDLPWSVNRLEQRFGRLDRFADGHVQDAVCKVLVDSNNDLLVIYAQFLLDATGVFSESVATAQQSLVKVMRQLTHQIWINGLRKTNLDYAQVRELISVEKEEVEELEDIESESSFGDFPESSFRKLQIFEEQWSETQKVIDKVTDSKGGLGIHRALLNDSRIFKYKWSSDTRIPTVLRKSVELNLSPRATFHRLLALNNPGTEMLRVGNQMVDFFDRYLQRDDLGRVAVGWVKDDDMEHPYIDFSVEVLVTPDFKFLREIIPVSDYKRVQRRIGTSLQPQIIELRLDEEMNPLETEKHVWGSETRLTSGNDLINVFDRRGSFTHSLELFEKKLPTIIIGRLREQIEVALQAAKADSERRVNSLKVWKAGIVHEEIELEELIADELDHGLRNPKIKVLSIAAVVHSYEEF